MTAGETVTCPVCHGEGRIPTELMTFALGQAHDARRRLEGIQAAADELAARITIAGDPS